MDSMLLIARFVLAAVFVVAGLAKLADRSGSIEAARAFGVPPRATALVAILLPAVELAVAVLLIVRATARAGAVAALAVLIVFLLAMVANLARGHRPDCRCFRQLRATPVGWPTVSRNLVLALLATFVAWQGPGGGALAGLTTGRALAVAAWLALLALVLAVGWFALNLLRQNGRILLRLDAVEYALVQAGISLPSPPTDAHPVSGLPVGTAAPDFALPGLDGGTYTLRSLLSDGIPLMLLFSDSGCRSCAELRPEMGRWQQDHVDDLTIALITTGAETDPARSDEPGLDNVLVQQDDEVTTAYQVTFTPSALIVSDQGTIASPVVAGPTAIRELVRRTADGDWSAGVADGSTGLDTTGVPSAPKPGDRAPDVRLTDLTGSAVDLTEFRGRPAVLLFWNPACSLLYRDAGCALPSSWTLASTSGRPTGRRALLLLCWLMRVAGSPPTWRSAPPRSSRYAGPLSRRSHSPGRNFARASPRDSAWPDHQGFRVPTADR